VATEFVTGTQAAAILGVTRRSIYNMIQDGRIRAYRIGPTGRDLRIRRNDLEAALVPVEPSAVNE
jgi:excisionase family DNA binding protein